jgi:hypothetical protein
MASGATDGSGIALLACPRCRSQLSESDSSVTCTGCGQIFPVSMGVIDFRDAEVDTTADFSIEEDRIVVDRLLTIFTKTTTFNEIHDAYESIRDKLKKGIDIATIDMDQLLKDEQIRPKPLSPDQLVHGHSILQKIPEYLCSTVLCLHRKG